jgi:ribosomal protein S18 acetylase RimI-like enzyme
VKSTILLSFLLVCPAGSCHERQHTANGDVQSTQFSNSTLLNTYENGYKVYLNESNDRNIEAVIRDGLQAYNNLKDGDDTWDHCTVTITSAGGEIIAGATGDICKNEKTVDTCFLDTLWVHEDHRHRGLGTKVMQALSQHVSSKGCKIIQLHAYEYQDHAKDFFEKLGFKTTATVPTPDTLAGFAMYIMRKSLIDNDLSPMTAETDYQVHIETSWNETNSKIIVDRLNAYNALHVHAQADNPYTIFLVSDSSEIIGGAFGHICILNGNAYCDLSALWVHEKYRQHKLGTKLMNELVQYAHNKKCQLIQLETFEWQARGFYEKLGFILVATVPNIENCHGKEQYYMRKKLQ